MTSVKIVSGQSLLDVTLTETGTLENLFHTAKLNGGMSITDFLTPGNSIEIDDALTLVDKKRLDYIKSRGITLATAYDQDPPPPSGLGNEFLKYPEPILTLE